MQSVFWLPCFKQTCSGPEYLIHTLHPASSTSILIALFIEAYISQLSCFLQGFLNQITLLPVPLFHPCQLHSLRLYPPWFHHLLLRLWFRASLIYINNCPTRCNTKQSTYYSVSSLNMFQVSTTPIIRSTPNCNYSLRYSAATSLQLSQASPHWRR